MEVKILRDLEDSEENYPFYFWVIQGQNFHLIEVFLKIPKSDWFSHYFLFTHTKQSGTAQYSAVQYITVQCSAVQCSTVHNSAVQYSTVHNSAVQYITVQCSAVQYST